MIQSCSDNLKTKHNYENDTNYTNYGNGSTW